MGAEDIGRGIGRAWRNAGRSGQLAVVAGMVILLSFCAKGEPTSRQSTEKVSTTQVAAAPRAPVVQEKPTDAVLSRSGAAGACMLFIKRVLHDPDSASFGHSREAEVLIKGTRAMVIRSVRATNGFGAVRTADFICLMEQRGDMTIPVLVTQKGQDTEKVRSMLRTWGMF